MTNTSKYFLGVDGGATKTEAVIIDQNKKEIGRGLASGSNADIFGLSESIDRVFSAVEQARSGKEISFQNSCIAIAGIDTPKDHTMWERAIKKQRPIYSRFVTQPKIVNDILAALRSGSTSKNAIVIISGTGSNCYGRIGNGNEAKSGGMDYILSDEGSGYSIGLRILKRVTQSIDGRSRDTLLKTLLFEKLNITTLNSLSSRIYEKPWNKTDIASLAPLVEKAAKKGDKVAIAIIKKAAHDLAIMIEAVAGKLKLKNKKYDIVTSGSIFKIQNILMSHFKKDIRIFSPRAQTITPKVDSATGAALIALESS